MSLNRYLKSHTLQFHSVHQSDTVFLIIRRKDKYLLFGLLVHRRDVFFLLSFDSSVDGFPIVEEG